MLFELQRGEDICATDAFMRRRGTQDIVQGADAQASVGGNRNPVVGRFFGFEDDMAAGLMHL